MIVDLKCPECGRIKEDVLLKKIEDAPDCPDCGRQMERLWTLRKPKDGEHSNHSSLRFHFNYLEP